MLVDRILTIKNLEKIRESKVLVYFLSDRRSPFNVPGMNTAISGEPQLLFYDHLKRIGKVKKLDMVLHTRGGNIDAVWPLVNVCRSFTEHFSVLVPLRAHSAGTLICLGADEILLGTAAELSPIDPSLSTPFNPVDVYGNVKSISVEDVSSFFKLARDANIGVGITEEEDILEVFKMLTAKVEPLALGAVYRAYSQIRTIAGKLLSLHMDNNQQKELIAHIVKVLCEELFSHTHSIGREEAREIFGNELVRFPSWEEENALWQLFESYADFFQLRDTFNLKQWIGAETEKELEVTGAAIESEYMSHLFRYTSAIRSQAELPQQIQIQLPAGQPVPKMPGFPQKVSIEPLREGWYNNAEGK